MTFNTFIYNIYTLKPVLVFIMYINKLCEINYYKWDFKLINWYSTLKCTLKYFIIYGRIFIIIFFGAPSMGNR